MFRGTNKTGVELKTLEAVLYALGHRQDLDDVREMLKRGLVRPEEILRYFGRIEPELYRYPAIHPPSFRKAVEQACNLDTIS